MACKLCSQKFPNDEILTIQNKLSSLLLLAIMLRPYKTKLRDSQSGKGRNYSSADVLHTPPSKTEVVTKLETKVICLALISRQTQLLVVSQAET